MKVFTGIIAATAAGTCQAVSLGWVEPSRLSLKISATDALQQVLGSATKWVGGKTKLIANDHTLIAQALSHAKDEDGLLLARLIKTGEDGDGLMVARNEIKQSLHLMDITEH